MENLLQDAVAVARWIEGLDGLRLDLLVKMMLATVLGGIIGVERESRGKAAGFRTNVLIAVGATLLTDMSISLAALAPNGDPGRIASYVVSGMGFIGGGTIIQARGNVTGITTAATLWVVAAIGIALGGGAYTAAVGGTLFVLATLIVLGRLEARLNRGARMRTLHVEVNAASPDAVALVSGTLRDFGTQGALIRAKRVDADQLHVDYRLEATEGEATRAMESLLASPDVVGVLVS